MNKLRRYICLLLLAATALGLCACGGSASEQANLNLEDSSSAEEKEPLAVQLSTPADFPAAMTSDGSAIYHVGQADSALEVHSLDVESGQWAEVLSYDTTIEKGSPIYAAAADGSLIVAVSSVDTPLEYLVLCFDLSTGQLLSQFSLELDGSKMGNINGIMYYEGKLIVWSCYGGQVAVYDLEGRRECSYGLSLGSIQSVSCLNGTPVMCYATSEQIYLGTMDLSGYQPVAEITVDQRCELNCISNSQFLAGGTALYKFDMGSGELEPVLYWRDIADIPAATQVYALDDEIVIGYNEYYNTVIKYDLNAIPERQQITIGAMQYGGELEAAVAAFNSQSEEYVARLKIYGLEEMDRFLVDISAGDTLDIVCTGLHPGDTTLDYSTLDSGAFEDLLPYIDADPELSRDDFLPQALEFMVDENGRMYELYSFMNAASMISSKEIAEQVSGPEDLLYLSENLPEGYALFGGISQDVLLNYICQLASVYCVDFETGESDFSKGSFDKWLKLYSGFEAYDQNAYDGYLISVPSAVTLYGAAAMRERYGEDYQYMGWPNGEGNIPLLSGFNGGYSMLASSQHKDAAWQMLRELLFIENDQVNPAILLPVMDEQFQQALASLPELKEDAGIEVSEEDIEKVVALLEGPSMSPRKSGIDSIIKEVAQKYAAGQLSLEAAVSGIQSRASIYMSEQYG